MARVIALARTARQQPLEALRLLIVSCCALALIAAHPFHF
jgi:hypothetical protein